MRHREVAQSKAGQTYPSPSGFGARSICAPSGFGNNAGASPAAIAVSISSAVKKGRKKLSRSGNRQQTSQLRQAELGTICRRASPPGREGFVGTIGTNELVMSCGRIVALTSGASYYSKRFTPALPRSHGAVTSRSSNSSGAPPTCTGVRGHGTICSPRIQTRVRGMRLRCESRGYCIGTGTTFT